jgi:hypothetical protein
MDRDSTTLRDSVDSLDPYAAVAADDGVRARLLGRCGAALLYAAAGLFVADVERRDGTHLLLTFGRRPSATEVAAALVVA